MSLMFFLSKKPRHEDLRHEFHPGRKKESNRFRLRLKQIPGTYAKGLCYGIKTLERGFPPATDKLTDSLRRNT